MCPIIKSTQTSSSHKVKHLPMAVIYRTSIFTERFGKGGQGKSPLSLARLLTEVYAISWYQSGDDMGGVDTGKRQQENSPLINNLTLVIHELGRFSKVTFSSWARVGDGGEGNGDWEVENLSSTPIAYRSLGAHANWWLFPQFTLLGSRWPSCTWPEMTSASVSGTFGPWGTILKSVLSWIMAQCTSASVDLRGKELASLLSFRFLRHQSLIHDTSQSLNTPNGLRKTLFSRLELKRHDLTALSRGGQEQGLKPTPNSLKMIF